MYKNSGIRSCLEAIADNVSLAKVTSYFFSLYSFYQRSTLFGRQHKDKSNENEAPCYHRRPFGRACPTCGCCGTFICDFQR